MKYFVIRINLNASRKLLKELEKGTLKNIFRNTLAVVVCAVYKTKNIF